MTADARQAQNRMVVPGVRVSVLGPLTVAVGDTELNVGGPKQRTVLAMLVAHAGTRVSADAIVEAVYGEDAAASARRTVQTYVSTLRNELGEVIEKASGGWRLSLAHELIDAVRFEDLVRSAADTAEQAPERAGEVLREALALWRGHPYADVDAHGHLDGEVARLNELRSAAQEARIDVDLASGRHADLVGEIEALLVEHPYRERFRAQHMIALYRAGRQEEALRSYSRMRSLLVDEMGIDPSSDLQELEQRILNQDPNLLETAARRIQRRAVLVADPGDPMEIAFMPAEERDRLIGRVGDLLRSSGNGKTMPAGSATYAIFEGPAEAAAAAEAMTLRSDGDVLRLAIDWGDVEVGDGRVSGPPVSRAARLVAVAHRGQVLLSADAQQALSSGGGPGLRFETLGTFELTGLESPTPIYQLLVGNPPQTFPDLNIDRLPPPLPGGGHRSVPGYELREPIGRGSVGELYRAYQPSVGREVMIEVIGRSRASDPDFVRRFEADVQRLSLLDHPNISPILDYWREPDGAFVVYRHHRGGALDPAAGNNPERLIAQVGSALAYAHSYGVIHGSLTPDRVFLDETGNGYLLGFPIGQTGSVRSAEYAEYIAPETLEDVLATAETDIYALGVLAHELLEGGRPEGDTPVSSDIPAIARAIAEAPEARYGSISDFLIDLNPESTESPESRFTETHNPYKGLAAFHESDARDFFGRSELTRQLVERLQSQDFLAVVGPSGSGKSSVVRAGLIPAVRRGDIEGSETWLVTDMLPGTHPFLELRRALERVAVDMPTSVLEALAAEQPDALEDVSSLVPANAALMLLVDQFEELFTLVDETTRSHFVDLLSTAVKEGHASVVVTMRADFLDRPLAYSELADLFDRRMVTVGSPNQTELRDAVVLPAGGVGVEVDPALAERIVSDVHDRPGGLPLLQHALSEVFATRDSDLLSLDAYEEVGGVAGSLANRAERAYQSLDIEGQDAAKQVLLRLVTIIDESAPTRRRVRVTDLDDLNAEEAIAAFVVARLLVIDSDPDTRTPTVEVAHEALLTNWPRLAGWLEVAREDIAMARRLDEAVRDWEASGQDDGYLLVGGRLAQHQAWTSSSSLTLTESELDYLQKSVAHDERRRAQRRRRRNWIMGGFAAAAVVASVFGVVALRNAASAEEAAALAKARETAASSISVRETNPELATLLAIEAFNTAPSGTGLFPEAMIALRQAADANRLVGRIERLFASDVAFTPDGAGLLVVDSGGRSVSRFEIGDGFGDEVWEYQDLTTIDTFQDVAVHPTDDLAAISVLGLSFGGEPGDQVELVDGDDGKKGRVLLLDTSTGDMVGELDVGECVEPRIGAFFISPDGSLLGVPLVALDCAPDPDWFGHAMFDTVTWTEVHRFDHADVNMTQDMTQILVDYDAGRPAELLTFPDLELVDEFDIDLGEGGVRFISPDGKTIVYRTGNTIDIRPGFWDVESNSRIAFGDGFGGFFVPPTEPTFTPEGAMLAPSTESDVLYDVATGTQILELPTRFTANASISPEGDLAATANHNEVLLWEIGERNQGRTLEQEEAGIIWLNPDTIDASGPRTTLLGFDHFTRSIHPETGEESTFEYTSFVELDPGTGDIVEARQVHAYAQLPNGGVAVVPVALGDPDDAYDDVIGPLTIWDPTTGAERIVQPCQVSIEDFLQPRGSFPLAVGAPCPDGSIFAGSSVAVSPDGRLLATISADPELTDPTAGHAYVIQIWDVESLEVVAAIQGQLDEVMGVAPYRLVHFGDGWLALIDGAPGSGDPTQLDIIDSTTGEQLAELQEEVPYRESFDVSPDGSSVYLIGESGEVFEYDTSSWRLSRSWAGIDGRPRGMAVRDDGRFLAASGEDGVIAIWDLEPEDPVLVDRIPMGTWVSDITWIDEDRMGAGILYPGAQRTEWRVIELDQHAVVASARASLVRDFTPDECRTYGIERCEPSSAP